MDLSGDGVACTTASGAFSVDQISLDGSGNPVTFSSRFEFHCNAEDPAVIGAVSYNATADYRTTTMPTAVADFGSVAAGGVPTPWKEVTVTNNGPSDLTLSSQGPDSLNFGVYLATCGQFTVLHVGESCVYQVRFQPLVGAAGPQSAWLRINENLAPSGGSAVRRIRLTGFVSSNPTPSWISLGGAVTADPSAVADPQDPSGVYAFVRGGDGALYWQHATGSTWSGYHAAGGVLTSLPFAVADPAGVSGTVGSYVFVRGGDGALYVGRIVGGVWQGWQPLGGYLTSFPAAVVDSSGLWVAVRGGDGALYARHLTSTGWSGWQSFGGYLDSAPSLAADASGAYAFVVGGDGALYARNIRGVASWQSLGGYVTAAPVGVGDAAGISVFVRGGDGATYWRHESGGARGHPSSISVGTAPPLRLVWPTRSVSRCTCEGLMARSTADTSTVRHGPTGADSGDTSPPIRFPFPMAWASSASSSLAVIRSSTPSVSSGQRRLLRLPAPRPRTPRRRTTLHLRSIRIPFWASMSRMPGRHADESRCPPSARVCSPIQERRMWPGRSLSARSIVARSRRIGTPFTTMASMPTGASATRRSPLAGMSCTRRTGPGSRRS